MDMRQKVLLADDDPEMAETLGLWLKKAGYSVVCAYSGDEAMAKVGKSQPDIILMDVLLGDANGMQLCSMIHKAPATRHIPVILMSSQRTGAVDMVTGLGGGADDYLVKPVNPKVLAAKVEAVLRRVQTPKDTGEVLKRFGLALNVSERRVRVGKKNVQLTRKEFDLLAVLLRRPGKVMSPNYLLETVWGYETEDYNDPRTVQVHISRLKKKLGKGLSSRIKNVIGSGYSLG